MIRYLFGLVWLVGLSSAGVGAESRCIFVLRDISVSYHNQLPAANHHIQSILQFCGPDDQLVIIDVGPPFQPKTNVRVQCKMPPASMSILEPTLNLKRWLGNQAILDALWNGINGRVQAIRKFLDQPTPVANSTDLYGALEYCSLRLKQGHCDEAYFFLYTDLHHDFQEVSSDQPPTELLSFFEARVETFFVPWTNRAEWQSKESAWQKWFVERGQARRFAMLTDADSLQRSPLPQNRAPKRLPSLLNH